MKLYVAALLAWGILLGMFLFVPPHSIADIFFKDSYLPLLIIWAIAHFFTVFALFKKVSFACVESFVATMLCLLQLHGMLNIFSLGFVLFPACIVLIAIKLLKKE